MRTGHGNFPCSLESERGKKKTYMCNGAHSVVSFFLVSELEDDCGFLRMASFNVSMVEIIKITKDNEVGEGTNFSPKWCRLGKLCLL